MSYVAAPSVKFHRIDSNKGGQTAASVTEPAPSYQTRGMKTVMEDDQRTVQTGQEHRTAPGNSKIRELGVTVANDGSLVVSNTNSVKPQTLSAAAGDRVKSSKPSVGVAASKSPAAPGILPRIDESHQAEELAETGPKINEPEGVGITVAGEIFRNVNPTAYYMAKKNLI